MDNIPSPEDIRIRLLALGRADLMALASSTGAPFHTLLKIRSGETLNPRIDTVRAIWPAIQSAGRENANAA